MAKANLYKLAVTSSVKITTNMQRLTLTSPELSQFPEGQESGYVKLYFSESGQALTSEGQLEQPSIRRTYTIRKFDLENREITIDFVLHEHNGHSGPASSWAKTARPGDTILMSGPGATKLVNNQANWFLLAGDMTALPAISCNLEQLPADAKGYAVIEINHESDKQPISAPEGIEIHWLPNSDASSDSSALLDSIRTLDWPEGKPSIWAACEFSSMRTLRKYFKTERQVAKEDLYISSYWKKGLSEERHKVEKRRDASEEVSRAGW